MTLKSIPNTPRSSRVRGLVVFALLCGAGAVQPAVAVDINNTVEFNIKAQRLSTALLEFSKQAGLQILTNTKAIENLDAPAIKGRMSPTDAIIKLLQGTKLKFRPVGENAIAIQNNESTANIDIEASFNLMLAADLSGAAAAVSSEDTKNGDSKDGRKSAKSSAQIVEEMIVEKGRIKPFSDANADLPRTMNDPQPYYIFDSKEIERSGALSLQDFLRQRLTMDATFQTNSELYPVNAAGVNINSTMGSADGGGIPGSAISSFNLRGLGASKTLILVNGRRMAGVTYSRGTIVTERQPDLNGISLASVDRVEVLPSSASAIYGGSAIGGVINIILKRNYQGGDVRLNYDTPSHSSASNSTATATYGFSLEGGKSQVLASLHYSSSKPMVTGDRLRFMEDGFAYFTKQSIANGNSGWNTGDPLRDQLTALIFNAALGPTGSFVYWTGNNGLILKDGTVVLPNPASGLNFAYIKPGTTSATPMAQRWLPVEMDYFSPTPGYGPWGKKQTLASVGEVKSANVSLTRQMNGWLDAFADVRVNDNSAEMTYAPIINVTLAAPWYGGSFPANPFANEVVQYGFTLANPAIMDSGSTTTTVTAGFKTHFSSGWAGELSYTRSNNKFDHGYQLPSDYTIFYGVRLGLIDVMVDPFATQLDLSAYTGTEPFSSRSRSDEMALRTAGPVFHLPWGDPTLAIGLQRQKSSIPGATMNQWIVGELDADTVEEHFMRRVRETTHFPRSTTNDALYVEGRIPLVTEKNAVPLLRGLDVQLARRISRSVAETGTSSYYVSRTADGTAYYAVYTPVPIDAVNGQGGTPIFRQASYSSHNETFALKYEPMQGVTLRASVGTAFVPPSYSSLIPDQTFTPNGATITNDPVTLLPSYKANSISGGNPDLKPQRSESRDIGLIFEPRDGLLKGLRANLQYYQIAQYDFISVPNITELLTRPEFADRVTRNPITRQITLVDLSLTNIAKYITAGSDITLGYSRNTAWGDWDFSLGGSKIFYERRQSRVTSPMVDYAGFPGGGGSVKHKASANLAWGLRNLTLGWSSTWYGSYRAGNVSLQGDYFVRSQMYHNVFAGYDFGKDSRSKILENLGVQLNIQNVFNTAPPFDLQAPPFYLSPLGSYRLRAYAVSIKKAF